MTRINYSYTEKQVLELAEVKRILWDNIKYIVNLDEHNLYVKKSIEMVTKNLEIIKYINENIDEMFK